MAFSWQDRVVLVTGGSSGIGLEIARWCAARGAHVWLMARGVERLAHALDQMRLAAKSADQRFGMSAVDLSDPDQASLAISQMIQEMGVPYLLVNSAGAAHPGYVQELRPAIFRWMMDANYFTTVYATKAVLPGMIARRSGHIVNLASIAGFLGVFGYSAYGASKFAVVGFSEVLRAELKQYDIRISVVFPSDTQTPQLEYENRFKPPETKALSGTMAPLSAERVAHTIMQQVEAGRYAIFTSLDGYMIYALSRILPKAWVFAILDRLIARVAKA